MKRLLALTLTFILLCSTALAGTHSITLTDIQKLGKTGQEWLSKENNRVSLMRKVGNIMRKNSIMKKEYGGFKIDAAISTACTGLDEDGNLFVAMLNPNTNSMLAVVVDPITFEGTFTVLSRAKRSFEQYQSMAEEGHATLYDATGEVREEETVGGQVAAYQNPDLKAPEAANDKQAAYFAKAGEARNAVFSLTKDIYAQLVEQEKAMTDEEAASSLAGVALYETCFQIPYTEDGEFEDEIDKSLKNSVNLFGTVALGMNEGSDLLTFMYHYSHSDLVILIQYDPATSTGTCRCIQNAKKQSVTEFEAAYDTVVTLKNKDVDESFMYVYQTLNNQ